MVLYSLPRFLYFASTCLLVIVSEGCRWEGRCGNWPGCLSEESRTSATTSRPGGLNQLGCGWTTDEHWIECCPTCNAVECRASWLKKDGINKSAAIPRGVDKFSHCCSPSCAVWNQCSAGHELNANAENMIGADNQKCCAQCSAGSFSVDQDQSCQRCSGNTFTAAKGQSYCKDCSGTVPATKDRCCKICGEGTVLRDCTPTSEGVCSVTCAWWKKGNQCSAGYELNAKSIYGADNQQCCAQCSAGSFSGDQDQSCQRCSGNTFTAAKGQSYCKDCSGTVPATKDRCCKICGEGSVLSGCTPTSEGVCSQCQTGTVVSGGKCVCLKHSDSACEFKTTHELVRKENSFIKQESKRFLSGADMIGRGIDVLSLGDFSQMRSSVLALEERPVGLIDPKSLNMPDHRCYEFHTRMENSWSPEEVRVNPMTSASCAVSSSFSSSYSDYAKKTGREFGVQLKGGYLKYSGTVGYNSAKNQEVLTNFRNKKVMVESSCDLQLYNVALDDHIATPYEESFLTFVSNLSTEYTSIPLQHFVDTFGTHIIMGVLMGGRLRQSTTISTDSCWTGSISQVTSKVEAGFNAAFKEGAVVGVDASDSAFEEEVAQSAGENVRVTNKWSSIGGNPALVDTSTNKDLCTDAWRLSTRPWADAMSFQLKTIDTEVYEASIKLGESSDTASKKSEVVRKYILDEHLGGALERMKEDDDSVIKPKPCNSFAWNKYQSSQMVTVVVTATVMVLL